MIRILLCLSVLSLMLACTQEAGDRDSYFPLAPGLRWVYRVTTEVTGHTTEERLKQYNADLKELDGLLHTVRVTDQGTRYYIRENDDGVYRAAKQTIVELRPQADTPHRWILKKPFQVGNSWSQVTHPYVLRRLQPYEETLAKSMKFKMAYQISSLTDFIDVPAGRFENCIRVDGDAQLTVYADGRTGYQDIKIDTSEWYAPGVGLVKLVRNEPLPGEVFAGGRIVLELERFEH